MREVKERIGRTEMEQRREATKRPRAPAKHAPTRVATVLFTLFSPRSPDPVVPAALTPSRVFLKHDPSDTSRRVLGVYSLGYRTDTVPAR